MSYSIEFIKQESIETIKSDWEELEKGRDMTYFQTYEWYRMLIQFTPNGRHIDSVYAIIRNRHKEAILIAPLWIIKKNHRLINKKGIFFIGRKSCTDYLNFIYKDFHEDVLDYLLNELNKRYDSIPFHFEQIKENTLSFEHLKGKGIKTATETCVKISLTNYNTAEDYAILLSKSTRQNLRTAKNRLEKDGKSIEIIFDDKKINIARCRLLRNTRLSKKITYKPSLLESIKTYIYNKLETTFPTFQPHDYDKNRHFLSVYCDGDLQMFFCYAEDLKHEQILIMTAGVNEEYSRYSLGMIGLFEFIKHVIEDKVYDEIDLLKGCERYKYALGGVEHYIHEITI